MNSFAAEISFHADVALATKGYNPIHGIGIYLLAKEFYRHAISADLSLAQEKVKIHVPLYKDYDGPWVVDQRDIFGDR